MYPYTRPPIRAATAGLTFRILCRYPVRLAGVFVHLIQSSATHPFCVHLILFLRPPTHSTTPAYRASVAISRRHLSDGGPLSSPLPEQGRAFLHRRQAGAGKDHGEGDALCLFAF